MNKLKRYVESRLKNENQHIEVGDYVLVTNPMGTYCYYKRWYNKHIKKRFKCEFHDGFVPSYGTVGKVIKITPHNVIDECTLLGVLIEHEGHVCIIVDKKDAIKI